MPSWCLWGAVGGDWNYCDGDYYKKLKEDLVEFFEYDLVQKLIAVDFVVDVDEVD